MLTEAKMTTMLPIVDVGRAREFYERRLGLKNLGTLPDGKILYDCGGSQLALFPRTTPTKAEHTAVSFEVKDLEREVAQLSDRGVRFEDYDLPGLKTVNKICVLGAEKAAWFKDPDGNTLCLHQMMGR